MGSYIYNSTHLTLVHRYDKLATVQHGSLSAPAPAAAVTAHPHRHRLRVPPPPGGPGAPAASPPGRRKPRSSRRVRPSEDPFLAAYLACTEDSANGGKRLLGWAGLGLGLGLGMRGLGLSCKSSCGAVEECVVRLAKVPGLDED